MTAGVNSTDSQAIDQMPFAKETRLVLVPVPPLKLKFLAVSTSERTGLTVSVTGDLVRVGGTASESVRWSSESAL